METQNQTAATTTTKRGTMRADDRSPACTTLRSFSFFKHGVYSDITVSDDEGVLTAFVHD